MKPAHDSHQDDTTFYVECSVRPGMTLGEYRRSRPCKRSRWERLKELAGGASVVAIRPA